jgi:hypothetical protein
MYMTGFIRKIQFLSVSPGRKKSMSLHQVFLAFTACCLAAALILLSAGNGPAHVSSDSMPDSVAEVEYSIYLEFKPNDLQVRNKLGMVYYRLGKLAEADTLFSAILA